MGSPLLGLLAFLWSLANSDEHTQVQQVCLVAMSVAVTWAVLGTAAARANLSPWTFVFPLPFGGRIAPALQEITSRVALAMLTLSDVVRRSMPDVISIGGDRWRVTEACGGIIYFVASLAVGYLYAGAVYRQWGHRAAFLVASAVVPLAANGLRVYTTILLDHLGATRVVAGMGHYFHTVFSSGWSWAFLFMTCGRWREGPSTGEAPVSFLSDELPSCLPRQRAAPYCPP